MSFYKDESESISVLSKFILVLPSSAKIWQSHKVKSRGNFANPDSLKLTVIQPYQLTVILIPLINIVKINVN